MIVLLANITHTHPTLGGAFIALGVFVGIQVALGVAAWRYQGRQEEVEAGES